LSAAVAAYFAAPATAAGQPVPRTEDAAPADPYAAARAEGRGLLERARRGVLRRLEALAGDEPAPGAAQALRTQAEWLLALHTTIAPGQTQLEIPPFDAPTGETLVITVDAVLGPVEQAQRLFRRAARLDRAAVFIPQRRAELQADLELIDQLALDLQRAANQPEIAAVRRELTAAGLIAATGGKPKPAPPASSAPGAGGLLRVRSRQGLEILVGRSARQNERITFSEAHPGDLWLHARGVPGSHVVIRSGGQTPDAATVRLAAQWAAYHSAARGDAAVNVTVTHKRWVRRAPGGKLGQVLVEREEQVISVPGEEPGRGNEVSG
jgi:predicted ribosome quality control (RQC) complex YloA/Tae2 family protein